MAMRADIRFHIRQGDAASGVAIGPGKIALLEAIAQTGSITAAAKALGMSYRRAWLLVDATNHCLVRPAVLTLAGGPKGGGTVLTPLGVELVSRYRALEKGTASAVARSLKSILRTLPS